MQENIKYKRKTSKSPREMVTNGELISAAEEFEVKENNWDKVDTKGI